MKPKVIFILSFLILACHIICFSQNDAPTYVEDEEMNIFLMTLLLLAMGVMIGAGIIASIVVLTVFAFLFVSIALGILSTSVAIGLYNRSIRSGFKSFLIISFALVGGIIGTSGLLLINEVFKLSYDTSIIISIGSIAGTTGGIILALISYKIILYFIKHIKSKFVPT